MPDFGHLYRDVHPRLVAALTAACGDADLAADAAEEAAVRAIERWDRVHVGGLTEPEIAGIMGITRGTVSSTLRAAYGNLRAATVERDGDRSLAPPTTATVSGGGSSDGTEGGWDCARS